MRNLLKTSFFILQQIKNVRKSKKQLEQQLWNIAIKLRGKMEADDFRDYILGFIFYKYLSERMHNYADSILKQNGIKYIDIKVDNPTDKEYIEAIREKHRESWGIS